MTRRLLAHVAIGAVAFAGGLVVLDRVSGASLFGEENVTLGAILRAGWDCVPPAIPPAGARRVPGVPAAPAEDARGWVPSEGVLRRSRPASANAAPIASGRADVVAREVAGNEAAVSPAAGGAQ
jgi:hypothetical protein